MPFWGWPGLKHRWRTQTQKQLNKNHVADDKDDVKSKEHLKCTEKKDFLIVIGIESQMFWAPSQVLMVLLIKEAKFRLYSILKRINCYIMSLHNSDLYYIVSKMILWKLLAPCDFYYIPILQHFTKSGLSIYRLWEKYLRLVVIWFPLHKNRWFPKYVNWFTIQWHDNR